jgi:putative transposase
MARQLRLRLADYPMHVIQRGINRAACFQRDNDYLCYLQLLTEHASEFACAVHAYVLMTNHVHLLLTPQHPTGMSLLMKRLGQRYVQYVNRTCDRSGTLWEGRFRSSVVDEQAYLLSCYRYIELNPVRAGIVDHPRKYPWSSYRANGERVRSALVTPHAEYVALGADAERRADAYRGFFEGPLDPGCVEEIRDAANSGWVLGRREFRAEIARMLQPPAQSAGWTPD